MIHFSFLTDKCESFKTWRKNVRICSILFHFCESSPKSKNKEAIYCKLLFQALNQTPLCFVFIKFIVHDIQHVVNLLQSSDKDLAGCKHTVMCLMPSEKTYHAIYLGSNYLSTHIRTHTHTQYK